MNKPTYLFMPDKDGPLVYLDFAIKVGAIKDPQGKDGLASLTLSMLLRGTKTKTAKEFHEALDQLGAEIHLGKNKESLRIYGVVLRENLKPFLKLFRETVTEPRFDPAEFKKLKSQFKSALLDELSSDDDIADRRFQEYLLWGHPYGKMVSGSLQAIDQIQLDDIENFYQSNFGAAGVIFSASGAFDKVLLKKEMEKIVSLLPAKNFARTLVENVCWPKGKNLLLLHKEDRTQSQIIIGTKGIGFAHPDYTALQVANHVFGGGSFSARLMKEVREKRGWSYGAYAGFRAGRKPISLSMQTVPATKDTVPALKLMLKLFGEYAKKGISKPEFEFAKKSLINQAAFMQDTLRKRLDNKVAELLLELPKGFYDGYLDRLKSMTYSKVQKAIKANCDPNLIFALVLGDSVALEAELKSAQKWRVFVKKNFDQAPEKIF